MVGSNPVCVPNSFSEKPALEKKHYVQDGAALSRTKGKKVLSEKSIIWFFPEGKSARITYHPGVSAVECQEEVYRPTSLGEMVTLLLDG